MSDKYDNIRNRFGLCLFLFFVKFKEFVRFDRRASIFLLTFYSIKYLIVKYISRSNKCFKILGKIFRHIDNNVSRKLAKKQLTMLVKIKGEKFVGDLFYSLCDINKEEAQRLRSTVLNDDRPFDKRLIILSPPCNDKKGVLLIKYTNYFKYFIHIFDMNKINKNYILVLEPSSCGYFDEDLLCMLGQANPLIVQTPELVDKELLNDLKSNLIPIEVGANNWVDHRVFFPNGNVLKKYDCIMVAFWGDVKRHYRLFESVSKIESEKRPKIALIGVPWPRSIEEIKDIARYYKVENSLEIFENLSQEQINVLQNESKLAILLSKKEGFNKSIIEAMFSDIPSFILYGHNFGYEYPYLNRFTGGFLHDDQLGHFLRNIDAVLKSSSYSPREWVMENVSCKCSTEKLKELLTTIGQSHHISINKELAVKINNPNLDYFDQNYWLLLKPCYERLKLYLR